MSNTISAEQFLIIKKKVQSEMGLFAFFNEQSA
jgi:hypothetical protein